MKDTLFVQVVFYDEYGKSIFKFYNNNNSPFFIQEEIYMYKESIYEDNIVSIDYIDTNFIHLTNFKINKWCISNKLIPIKDYDAKTDDIKQIYDAIRN